ncbi:putative phage infection (PIP) family protein YhgE [Spirosoma lacussanchae]|uniref:hypothetical protein n=1 Tax=Spirosoma lacussanchae TaxID=1884249 RepID=UPI001107DF42|nr:hypothetical protein [Spirosoma lacussanchae]
MPEPDQSIGRKILSFFVKEEEPAPGTAAGTAPASTTAQPRPAAPAQPVPASPVDPVPTPAVPPGTVDPKFAQHFADVLAQNNPPGPDYFEFRETLRSLNNLGLTEEKQYQAAWASFKALSGKADVSLLTNTASQYIAALNKDRDGFSKSVEAALAERVGGLQNEQKRLQSESEALAKQLLEIQKQIDANTQRLNAIGGEITEQSTKITQNRGSYDATFAHFTDQIRADIDKIKSYLN